MLFKKKKKIFPFFFELLPILFYSFKNYLFNLWYQDITIEIKVLGLRRISWWSGKRAVYDMMDG